MSFLTIVTVCRNEQARIEKTLDSVVKQACRDFEWIVLDGASTDGTLAILEKYKERMSILRSEPDRGIYDAMNKAIGLATGEYLLFLNGGDWLADDRVVGDYLERNLQEDVVIGDILVRYPGGREQYRPSEKIGPMYDHLYWRSLPHQSTFIRRELFLQHGLYNEQFKIIADWEFFLRAILRGGATVARWARNVAVFTHDGISASPAHRQLFCKERIRMRRMYYPWVYRFRREANEILGRTVNRMRQKLARKSDDSTTNK
ncbi:MAG: hypothetical protein A2X46_16525 [Lentisphaerae bacterium GWF2_57_35]|nr:MAG: hypothetical protein A2X46_16525 [Lentisphaerae bacterium GWF2_57_35]